MEPVILLECPEERCRYVVYDAQNGQDNSAEAERLLEEHLAQHEDPEGWKADHPQDEED